MLLKRISMAVASIEIEFSVSRNGYSMIFSSNPYDYVGYRDERDTNFVSRSCHAPVTLSVTAIHHDTHPETPKSAKNQNFPFVPKVHQTIQLGAKCTETHVLAVKKVLNDFCGSYRPLLQDLP